MGWRQYGNPQHFFCVCFKHSEFSHLKQEYKTIKLNRLAKEVKPQLKSKAKDTAMPKQLLELQSTRTKPGQDQTAHFKLCPFSKSEFFSCTNKRDGRICENKLIASFILYFTDEMNSFWS